VAVGILAILAAAAVPSLIQWRDNEALRRSARAVGDAFQLARTEAVRNGDNHLVLLGEEVDGTPLLDANGNPRVVILNDGPPGGPPNCDDDPGEAQRTFRLQAGVAFGADDATSAHPLDTGAGNFSTGSTFTQPPPKSGNPPARWVLFRPDGVPVGVTDGCVPGATGSGGGAVYLDNGQREYAVVLTPLGTVRVSPWEQGGGTWQ